MILSTPAPPSTFLATTKPSPPFLRVSKLCFLTCSSSLSLRFRSTARRSTTCTCVLPSLNFHAMAELVKDKEVFASASAQVDDEKKKDKARSRSFLDATTEQELLSGIRKEAEAGKLPSNVAAGMEELYQNYKTAVLQSGIPNAHEIVLENMAVVLDRIFLDVQDPFVFSPYHKALRKPFDYYDFGQKYIRPLIDFRNSYVGNVSIFNGIEEKLRQGHNIVLVSNHQTEADPAVIALLLETSIPHTAENLHMNDVPEHAEEKRKANIRSLKEMALLLRGGSQVVWIAPSGGRDRPDPLSGEWYPANFDASSVDNIRRLAEHSGAPGHVYPLALLCHDIMPPPPEVEKEIGERRVISFHGAGLSVAPEISFSEITAAYENPEEAKEAYSEALYKSVTEQYNVLKFAIHGKQGLGASIPTYVPEEAFLSMMIWMTYFEDAIRATNFCCAYILLKPFLKPNPSEFELFQRFNFWCVKLGIPRPTRGIHGQAGMQVGTREPSDIQKIKISDLVSHHHLSSDKHCVSEDHAPLPFESQQGNNCRLQVELLTQQIKNRDNGKLSVVSTSSPSLPLPLADDNSLDVLLIDTKRGNKIVAFYLKSPYARLTVLYSHGNAADLGQLYDLFVQLKPSESNTYADIEAVYECLQTQYGVSQEDLILYGQSVGSGPTLHLAAKLPRLRGVVLHSAILSGLRVLCHVKFTFCFDIYKNINKIRKVKCPVLVIHGTEDDVVNWLHGDGLWKMAKEPYEPLWIKGGGHCNLELYPDYIRHLCRFIHEMENITTEIRLKKIRQNLHLKPRSKTASNKCCRFKLWRPKCPECFRPSAQNVGDPDVQAVLNVAGDPDAQAVLNVAGDPDVQAVLNVAGDPDA
ncbi:unnamed protein product [Dovyalis caffra]|uniref:glycerol-3-phosphate 1-O-acyltransferase n=1 Tax=Dovyalis caffra TaxID=77055 RepID=A0AAV1SR75_9ROSI|nr:unnamed protein product [Dovyalis caffra]